MSYRIESTKGPDYFNDPEPYGTLAEARRQLAAVRKWARKEAYYEPSYRGEKFKIVKDRENMAKKKSPQKRISAALSRYLKKLNPAKMRGVTHMRVKKLKNGGATFTPVRGNGKVISGYGSTTMNPRRRRATKRRRR
jgi:hypothetical protein